jgi:hypothetical protein
VYCQDFTDARDCQRVLKELFRMGFNVRAAFKPDFYTYLGINSAEAGELKIKEVCIRTPCCASDYRRM